MRIIKYIFKNYFSFKANTQVFPIAVSVAKNESIDPTKGILNNSCNITVTIINKAKRAFIEKTDNAYKSLGKYVFKEMKAQDSRKPEFVNKPNNE